MSETIWERIYNTLLDGGIDVYPPATKLGECLEPYTVVKNSVTTSFQDFSTNVKYYHLLCYIPKGSYSKVESYTDSVKGVMEALIPMIYFSNEETESYYDDERKAFMVRLTYHNYRKI